jgi:hypothetical protein
MRTDILGWLRLQWDRAAAWTCVLAGAVELLWGWVGVSGTPFTAKQLPYIASCGLGGIFLLGTGAMLWLSADLRDEWRKLDRIEAAIREHGTAGLDAPAVASVAPDDGSASVTRSRHGGTVTRVELTTLTAVSANGRTP